MSLKYSINELLASYTPVKSQRLNETKNKKGKSSSI